MFQNEGRMCVLDTNALRMNCPRTVSKEGPERIGAFSKNMKTS